MKFDPIGDMEIFEEGFIRSRQGEDATERFLERIARIEGRYSHETDIGQGTELEEPTNQPDLHRENAESLRPFFGHGTASGTQGESIEEVNRETVAPFPFAHTPFLHR